jgi:hypothetical protein
MRLRPDRPLLVSIALACLAAPSGAQTPDGLTPAVEEVCDEAPEGLFGLCNAFCEALDCELQDPADLSQACRSVKRAYLKKSGGAEPPCGSSCTGPPPMFLTLTNDNTAVRAWYSNGDGTFFAYPTPIAEFGGLQARYNGVGDFNGDGALDALVWSPDDRSRWIASSCDGEWTLEPAGEWTYNYGGGADLNGDGCTDLVGWDMSCCFFDGPVLGPGVPFLGLSALGDCSGGFTELYGSWDTTDVLGNWQAARVHNLEDCDGDGNADLHFLAYASGGASPAQLFLAPGDGGGGFLPPYPVGTVPGQPQNYGDLGDIDGDGCTDWVGGPDDDGDRGSVFATLGDCAGGFGPAFELVDVCEGCPGSGSGHGSGQSRLYDWDGDGDLDLLVSHTVDTGSSAQIDYFENLGAGAFGPAVVVVPPSELRGAGFVTPFRN